MLYCIINVHKIYMLANTSIMTVYTVYSGRSVRLLLYFYYPMDEMFERKRFTNGMYIVHTIPICFN